MSQKARYVDYSLFGPHLDEARAAGKAPGAAVCVDTEAGSRMLTQVQSGVPTRVVALGGAAGSGRLCVREAAGVRRSLDGMQAVLTDGVHEHVVSMSLFGDHHLLDAGLAAAMVEHTHPGRLGEAWASLASFNGVPGRLERVAPHVFVDYAHTPDSVAVVLRALRERTAEPLTIVLGCGGDRDRLKRPEMARAAALGADRVILTSDNPRSESPEAILDQMEAGLPAGAVFERIADRAAAIARAVRLPGVIVIAGKGHERTQVIAGRTLDFDDREEARRALDAQESLRRSRATRRRR